MGDLWFVKVVSLMSGECPIWNPSTITMSDQTLIFRGTYCLLVVATLLDIITPELIHNVDKFIAACQTYEGGFACSSFPFADGGRAAQAEAHGGYTSCALNSYFLLSTMIPPKTTTSLGSFPAAIDVDAALRWSVMQQGEAIEAGGFRGRSNKLVDGCYSWWVGGGVPVVEALAARAKGDRDEEGKLL
jgi:protein farnesyltransferase subunit beta